MCDRYAVPTFFQGRSISCVASYPIDVRTSRVSDGTFQTLSMRDQSTSEHRKTSRRLAGYVLYVVESRLHGEACRWGTVGGHSGNVYE